VVQPIATRLKRLREQSGLSVRKLAAAINVESSRYAYFEDAVRFKKPRLELGLARQIASVLADRGVDPHEVMALAGVEPHEAAAPKSAAQQEWNDIFDQITPEERELLLGMARRLLKRGPPDGERNPTVHSPWREFAGAEQRQ